jgi:hypothetical protein
LGLTIVYIVVAVSLHLLGRRFWELSMSNLDLILNPISDALAFGALVLIAAAIAVTGRFSYRRIIKKYPPREP